MMKKVVFMMLAVASLGFVACNSSSEKTQVKSSSDKDMLYSGILPSADADGTVYTLKLEWDGDHNYTDGDFIMIENTLATDTVAASGMKEVATSYTEGDFTKESKVVGGATIEYIRLVPDTKDALGTPSASSMYFIVNPDQSLTMVGASLEKSVNPELNYTLTVK